MNQDLVNQIKIYLNQFPQFLKDLLKDPLHHIDNDLGMDWVKIVLYGYLVEAITNVIYSIATLNISGIIGNLIFAPIQILIIIGFISFLIWFALDRFGLTQITFLSVFRIAVLTEIIVSIIAIPFLIIFTYVKSFDLIYIISALLVLAKAYLVYRGMTRQLLVPSRKASIIVGVITIFFLAPIVTDFFSGFSTRKQLREREKLHDIQMEQSIEELEKELGNE